MADPLRNALAALAHPIRREILRRLSERPTLHWSFLVEGFDCSRQAVAKHLRVLEAAQLITSQPEPEWHVFELRPEGFKLIDAWLAPFRLQFISTFKEIDEDI